MVVGVEGGGRTIAEWTQWKERGSERKVASSMSGIFEMCNPKYLTITMVKKQNIAFGNQI